MKIQAVIGGCFGDEGKGKTVSSLCLQAKKPLVIRFSGGQQAGHGVVTNNGVSHRFANFSSGTLHGADTYWSHFCTMDPVGIITELEILIEKGFKPWLYINSDCPITTPYEKQYNRNLDSKRKHGTCGVGVGQTHQRESDHFHLRARDLLYPKIFANKVELLRKYYATDHYPDDIYIESFMAACNQLVNINMISIVDHLPLDNNYDKMIFEGSQGLLLDESIGFFPHVTRGYTGTKNIFKFLSEFKIAFMARVIPICDPEVFVVTRAYQTRHGNGPMTNEDLIQYSIPDNPYEQSSEKDYAGEFRKSVLDLDLLHYGIQNDQYIKNCYVDNKTLVITCLDIINNNLVFTHKGKIFEFSEDDEFGKNIANRLGFEKYIISRSPITGEWQNT